MPEYNTEELGKYTSEIRKVDKELIELLNARVNLSLRADCLNKENDESLSEKHIQAIWREILSATRDIRSDFKAAYLGPEGTFSYYAGQSYLGSSTKFEPCTDFTEIFQKVSSGTCSVGVVPLENSLYGTVGRCFDLFGLYNVKIEAEFYSRIELSLLSKESSLMNIKTVYSHSQPLGQSVNWLTAHLPNAKRVSVESSALAAHLASNEEGAAAIAHPKVGETLKLNSLAHSIEDDQKNWTRFVIISNGNTNQNLLEKSDIDKSSVLFTIKDKSGALVEVLNMFAKEQVSLQKLESRPMPGECWKYLFFADLSCDICDSKYQQMIDEISEYCTSFKVLGCYTSGQNFHTQ